VYVTGLALAREPVVTAALRAVHQALAATAQATLFGILGLLVFPSQLVDDLGVAAVVTGILVFVARPVAVAVCLGWQRPSMAEGVVVAWAGLRGAVPIVLATIPLSAGHPDGAFVFDVVFVVVCLSLVLQATTVVGVARRLGLPLDPPPPASVVLVALEGVPGGLAEVRLGPHAVVAGSTLADAPLPGGARVVVIQRGDDTVVPSGATVLAAGDLLVVAGPVPGEDALVAWAGGTAPAGTGSAGTGSAGVRQAGATPRRGPGGTRRRRR
jgi:cell volume regulation protein A